MDSLVLHFQSATELEAERKTPVVVEPGGIRKSANRLTACLRNLIVAKTRYGITLLAHTAFFHVVAGHEPAKATDKWLSRALTAI